MTVLESNWDTKAQICLVFKGCWSSKPPFKGKWKTKGLGLGGLVLLDYLLQGPRDRWDWRRSKAEFGITMDSAGESLATVVA